MDYIKIGKDHPLCFGAYSYALIEKTTGKALAQLDYESLTDLTSVLYAGLVHGYKIEKAKCPYESHDDLLLDVNFPDPLKNNKGFTDLMTKVIEVLSGGFPKGE
jgi:hypothetical protein